jgi:phosphoribosylformylglycinamidine (FGAM) synthase-like enzyme
MAKTLKDEKLKAIAAEYMTNGMQKVKALLSVGYSKNYSEHCGLKIFDNDRFKQILAQIQAKTEVKTDITLAEVIENARYLINLGKEKQNGTDISNGNKQLGEMIAAFKQAIINEDKPKQLNSSEIEGLEQIASEYARKQSIKIG